LNSNLCGQKKRVEKRGGKGRQETTERLPPTVYKFPSLSPSLYRRHRRQEEGGAPRTSGACSGSTSSRASSWLISSSSTTSQGMQRTPSPFPLWPFLWRNMLIIAFVLVVSSQFSCLGSILWEDLSCFRRKLLGFRVEFTLVFVSVQ